MSIEPPPPLPPMYFYRSSEAPCPYLEGRIERKLFGRLDPRNAQKTNNLLTKAGFRRSHDILYKPACPGCQACQAVRIPVQQFYLSKNLKKIMRRGQNLRLDVSISNPNRSDYALFTSYQSARHNESDMALMTYEDYVAMMQGTHVQTLTFKLIDTQSKTIAILLVDKIADGWSAIYSFYETSSDEYIKMSLGTLLILNLIRYAQSDGSNFVYLGFWVKNSPKMDYKKRFLPLEVFTSHGWRYLRTE